MQNSPTPLLAAPVVNEVPVWRRLLTAVMVAVLMVLVGAAACAEQQEKKVTREWLRANSPTLRGKTRIRIGVREDLPYIGYRNEKGEPAGFDIEIAKALAKELGFDNEIDWKSSKDLPDRLSAVERGEVDIAIANISMTEERKEQVLFVGPYLVIPLAMMVRSDEADQLNSINDIKSERMQVCTTTGSAAEKTLRAKDLDEDLELVTFNTNDECMKWIEKRKSRAFVNDLHVLTGLREKSAKKDELAILDFAIGDAEERIGIAVPGNDELLRDLLLSYLDEWQRKSEGSPWLKAYDNTLGQLKLIDGKYRSQPRVNAPQLATKAPR